MDDIFVRIVNLPYRIDGTTVLDDDGNYNVYINSRTSCAMQRKSLRHELSHISKNHFYDGKPANVDEVEADAGEDEAIDPRIIPDIHF